MCAEVRRCGWLWTDGVEYSGVIHVPQYLERQSWKLHTELANRQR